MDGFVNSVHTLDHRAADQRWHVSVLSATATRYFGHEDVPLPVHVVFKQILAYQALLRDVSCGLLWPDERHELLKLPCLSLLGFRS